MVKASVNSITSQNYKEVLQETPIVNISHSWHPTDHSKNIYIKDDDPLTFCRHRASESTDAIRGREGYRYGCHAWRLTWLTSRGSYAVAGVGTKDAILHCKGYKALFEIDPNTWGWDLSNNISYIASRKSPTCYPTMAADYQPPNEIVVYLDMDNGTLSFEANDKYLGIVCGGLKGKCLYPMVSEVYGDAEVQMIYLGNRRPGQDATNLYTWNPNDCSENIVVFEADLHSCQRKKAVRSTDAIRCTQGFEYGRHIWQLEWHGDLGSHSIAGVGTCNEHLHCSGYTSLVGGSVDSWGWNISKKVLIHANVEQGHYPRYNQLPDEGDDHSNNSNNLLSQELARIKKFCVILDMDVGTLSYEVNGIYLGIAFHGLQGRCLYPMISTIIGDCKVTLQYLGEQPPASLPPTPLLFHPRHGLNGILSNDAIVASRKNAVSQFDDAVFMSSRPLQDGELFQLRVDNVMTRWNGCMQIGLTSESPGSLEFQRSLADLQRYPSWIINDNCLYINGQLQSDYHGLGVHCLKIGDYIGVSRFGNGQFHAYLNGKDLGFIANDVPKNVYAIVNLYGNCDCVTVVPEGNENIPPEILARGQKAIEAYNKASAFGCRKTRRSRFVILSKEQLGRKTISRILKGQGNLSQLVEEGGQESSDKKYSFSTIEGEIEKIQEQFDHALAKSIANTLVAVNHKQDADVVNDNIRQDDKCTDCNTLSDLEDDLVIVRDWHLLEDDRISNHSYNTIREQEALLHSQPSKIRNLVEKMMEETVSAEHQFADDVEDREDEEILQTHDVWDLSGQPIHNLSYRMFCNNKSVYVIAFDLTEDMEEAQEGNELCILDFILYWMSSIYSCAVGQNPSRKATLVTPTVFIIGLNKSKLGVNATPVDRKKLINSKFDKIREILRGKPYVKQMVPNFYAIDGQLDEDSDTDLAELIKSIDHAVESQPFMSEKIPLQWLKFGCLTRQMTQEGKYLLSSDEVCQLIASESHIRERSDIKVMLQYYHDLGNIVYYQENTGNTLNDITVILNPLWLAESFVKILTVNIVDNDFTMKSDSLELMNKRGILADDLINYMWQEIIDHRPMLLNLMESFDLLCRRLPPKKRPCDCVDYATCGNTYYVPSRFLNPKSIDSVYVPNSWDMTFYVDFDGFLPDGFYNRLLMHVVRWTQECSGREPFLCSNCARFYLNEDHDFILHRAHMRFARIKVTVQRINFEDEDDGVVVEVSRQACTQVLQFIKGTLANLCNAWIRHINYRIVVACTCNRLCERHNINGCQKEDCTHFHDLELCKSSKFVLCDHRRIRTAPYKKWFPPEVKIDKKSLGSLIESSNKSSQNFAWPHEVTDLLSLPGKANWRLLARKMGYNEIDICNWSLTADPAQAILHDWGKVNTLEHLYQLLESIQRDDVVSVIQEIEIAKGVIQSSFNNSNNNSDIPLPEIFISYQWDHQEEAKALSNRLERYGFKCWIDVGQMGGGDVLYQKIYDGIQAAQVVIACVTNKYVTSTSCSKEIILADMLSKPIIPVMLEKVEWPPPGAMAISFSQLIYIDLTNNGGGHGGKGKNVSPREKFSEIIDRVRKFAKPQKEQILQNNNSSDSNNNQHDNTNNSTTRGPDRNLPFDNISIGSSIFEDVLFTTIPRGRTTSTAYTSQCCNIL